MSRGGQVQRIYKHDTALLDDLAEAAKMSRQGIKWLAIRLCEQMDTEFPSLTLQEWKRRYSNV